MPPKTVISTEAGVQYPHAEKITELGYGMNLPGTLRDVADVIGEERALYLVRNWPTAYRAGKPGRQSIRISVYVPKRFRGGHALIDVLGQEEAQRMVDAFGGECLHLPNCTGNRGGRPPRNPHGESIAEHADNLATIPHGAMSMPNKSRGAAAYV
ncbi:hypothetical protein AWB77_06730 [Caballeronia fortuita]|uniref:Uncharacterized protein n=1 Tax=Caballeronia fortuita TaxID=1777138 RepID=A0A158E8H2_9BURK|nr:hypothetical protein [Caballeronia fortuita]SAL03182.1 hypothetical protein AWB77_06730 [Caballeronia fortuita]